MSRLRPKGVDHLAIRVHDLEVARAFYVDLIGCQFIKALPEFDQELLHAGATPISLVRSPAPERALSFPEAQAIGLDHFCVLLEDDATELRKGLSEGGVAVEDEVSNHGDNPPTLSLYVRDPSGNMVELRARLC
jgi:catechol 2,3-dioxygenase-like lactoylglutathione lyase family enzyme